MEPLSPRFRRLEPLSRRFEAFRLAKRSGDMPFAIHPAARRIEAPIHDTEEFEFWFTPEGAKS